MPGCTRLGWWFAKIGRNARDDAIRQRALNNQASATPSTPEQRPYKSGADYKARGLGQDAVRIINRVVANQNALDPDEPQLNENGFYLYFKECPSPNPLEYTDRFALSTEQSQRVMADAVRKRFDTDLQRGVGVVTRRAIFAVAAGTALVAVAYQGSHAQTIHPAAPNPTHATQWPESMPAQPTPPALPGPAHVETAAATVLIAV